MRFFQYFGEYLIFLKAVFSRPEKWRMFRIQVFKESYQIGVGSLNIISLVSFFVGAVATIQIGYQLTGSLLPEYVLGRIVRDSNILEFAPTISCLVLAGKIGSSIASEIGTMKVTEQIDALEIMGINSASYVTLAKIIGAIFTIPILVIYAMILSLSGGALSAFLTHIVSVDAYVNGLRNSFVTYPVVFSLVKAYVFAFVISTVSAYHGYKTEGGALEVGEHSTMAVVYSCMAIIFFDLIISQIMLL